MATHKVYVLRRADGLVKIGTTTNLAGRIASLTKAHGPLEIVRLLEGDAKRERQLHHQYRQLRQFGEWFAPTPEMLAELAALPPGLAVEVTATEARKAWEAAEAAAAAMASDKVIELVNYRCGRKAVKKAQAVDDLAADYGLPVSFLTHLHKRKASTVSAHGMAAIRAALVLEMKAYLAEVEAEIHELTREGK